LRVGHLASGQDLGSKKGSITAAKGKDLLGTGNTMHDNKNKKLSREEALEKAMKHIYSSRDFPVISKYLIEINQKLSDNSVYTTASELANIIIKDYALTNKLLKLVNSAFYGLKTGKVSTVSRAVVLLGYENVRLAAGTLILFEHFQSKSNMIDMKEAVVQCFWCGIIAREIVIEQKQVDPEEAFICAMLHDLGRLLTILHMPKEYTAIKLKALHDNLNERKAAKAVLGVSYASLGRGVARSWGFSEKIGECMGQLSTMELKSFSRHIDALHAVSAFVNRLGHALLIGTSNQVDAVFSNLCNLYKNVLDIDKARLNGIVEASLDKVRKHADALRLNLNKSQFLTSLEEYCSKVLSQSADHLSEQQPEPDKRQKSPFRLSDINVEQSVELPEKCAADPIAVLIEGLQDVISAMAVDPDVNNVALMSLEIIYRALKFDQVILFINDTSRQVMEVRYGYGCDLNSIIRKVYFKIEDQEKDIFSLALNLQQDLIVENIQDDHIRRLIPPWFSQRFNPSAFVFFPIMYKHICLGAIYADRNQAGPPISELEHRYVGMLRNQMILALKYCK
jgi:HD-like signal output (HDOD) protein